jgi:hypothetical protein
VQSLLCDESLDALFSSNNATYNLKTFFEKRTHIGPSRTEPKRVYTQSGATPLEVGEYGQYAIDKILLSNELEDFVRQ